MITCYIGINETKWNHHPTNPGPFACISPVYGATKRTKRENQVKIPQDTKVIQDSGAFSDGPEDRLSFSAALDRQMEHGQKFDYHDQVSHRASYDLLIDEMWTNGNRFKRRWSENDAWGAVQETIAGAKYMSNHCNDRLILSAQGVTSNQYLECVVRVLEWTDPSSDIFGLGGWCISGKMPSVMREPFDDTMSLIIPTLAEAKIKRVHIWGVMDALFLGPLLYLCDEHDLILSTDSSGPSIRPVMGEWGYKGWRDNNYKRPDVAVRGLHRALHVERTREWLANLRETQFYRPPIIQPKQMVLF
jgi:hypothetical protein